MIQGGLTCPIIVRRHVPRSREAVADSGRLGLFESRFATHSPNDDMLSLFSSLRKIERHLQSKPRLSATSKPLVKTNCHLRRDTAFSVDQIVQCLTGYAEYPGRFRHRKPKQFETAVPNRLARMRRLKHRHVCNLSVIVEKVHVSRIAILESEHNPPVRLHRHAPESGALSFQRMQTEPWQVHMFRFVRLIQARQNSQDIFEIPRVLPTRVIALIQALQATMPEATYIAGANRQASLVNASLLAQLSPDEVIR
jgi:hypothetical protein